MVTNLVDSDCIHNRCTMRHGSLATTMIDAIETLLAIVAATITAYGGCNNIAMTFAIYNR